MDSIKFKTIDEYISICPSDIRKILEELRGVIRTSAPNAREVISYNMPAFRQNKVLVYFAASKNHIGFYPTTSPIVVFEKELKDYKTSKGAIQFPLDKPFPFDLVKKIVEYRVQEDEKQAKTKMK